VITPPSIVQVLSAGWTPHLHPSARAQPDTSRS
jgi:hypothetical protein